jgi:hypothetical protein
MNAVAFLGSLRDSDKSPRQRGLCRSLRTELPLGSRALARPQQLRTTRVRLQTLKTYGGVDVYIHIFLTSALVGGEWLASRLGRFIPGKEPTVLIL